jgi:hypothetical protein
MSETEKAMTAFVRAARKVQNAIEEYRSGAGESRSEGTKIGRMIDRLDDRAVKPEIRGDTVANEIAYNMTRELRAQLRDAHDVAFEARRARREGEIAELDRKKREEWAALDPYERELRIRVAGRG